MMPLTDTPLRVVSEPFLPSSWADKLVCIVPQEQVVPIVGVLLYANSVGVFVNEDGVGKFLPWSAILWITLRGEPR